MVMRVRMPEHLLSYLDIDLALTEQVGHAAAGNECQPMCFSMPSFLSAGATCRRRIMSGAIGCAPFF
jgi:hypothetical protein